MSDAAQDQDAPDAKQLGDELLLAASGIRKKLITRLDTRLERSPFLNYAAGHDVSDALAHSAASVHPDLEPLARRLGRILALDPDALSAGHLRVLAQAGLPRTAQRLGGLVKQRGGTADVAATVRRHPIAAVLAAVAAGYAVGYAVR